MDHAYPIHTVETECQDCYKCLRHCPVKAIRVENGRAQVMPGLCVACGTCVGACPVHAKKIRDDLGRAKHLLKTGRPVYVSLAPSWVGEFSGLPEACMIAALRRLGFAGVSETALGAQEVSGAAAANLARGGPRTHVSSACPSAVEFLCKYLPEQAACITPLHSPLLAHARLLRRVYGEETGIVFFGPCVAKKTEADRHPELLDLALTFVDLRAWLDQAGVDPAALEPGPEDRFVPERSQEGALYPVEGGMIETLKAHGEVPGARFVTLAGLANIRKGLEGFKTSDCAEPLFIECLACEGGCVAGPCVRDRGATLTRRLLVERHTRWPEGPLGRRTQDPIVEHFSVAAVEIHVPDEKQVRQALLKVGKTGAGDELNCGGCGYNTCREFAAGLVDGRAEPTMCVSHMRKLAQNKANALLRCMPSGVVIVDRDLRIIECNEWFGRIFGEDVSQIYDVRPGLNRCLLAKVAPFADMFGMVLKTGRDLHYDHYRCDGRLFNITVFTIEPHQVAGGVVMDVTTQELRRDQIAQRANEVIKRNLSTVQEIACRLGEHMADTEVLLRSIAEGFAMEDGPHRRGGG